VLTITFVLIGFTGAAVKYWRWWPSHSQTYRNVAGIVCPLCPEILSIGTDREKFVERAIYEGPWNAVLALMIGWTVVVVIRSSKIRFPANRDRRDNPL